MICLDEIVGYMTENATWHLMDFLLNARHNITPNHLNPHMIGVENDEFCFLEKNVEKSNVEECEFVWQIGYIAFYALMGVPTFAVEDSKSQTSQTEVPYIGVSHCSAALSSLIHQCLLFDPSRRPKLSELQQCIADNMDKQRFPKKKITNAKGKNYSDSLINFWPEEMVTVISLVLMMAFPYVVYAQTDVPKEMTTIINRCKSLRTSANANKVSREFLYDRQWTLMDEIDIDRRGECTVKDKVTMFGVNDIGYRIAKRQNGVTNMGGRFRNGQDERYKFSFIEITIKKNMSVSYEITGRQGLQQFAVLPYHNTSAFTVSVTKGGKIFGKATMKDGTCYLQLDKKVSKSDRFKLLIQNKTGKNMAFVIVNYNPGK